MSFHALDFRAVVDFRKRARNIFKNLDLRECGFFLAEVEELRGQIASAPFELLQALRPMGLALWLGLSSLKSALPSSLCSIKLSSHIKPDEPCRLNVDADLANVAMRSLESQPVVMIAGFGQKL